LTPGGLNALSIQKGVGMHLPTHPS